jgi:SAM-dependent methyltransferase
MSNAAKASHRWDPAKYERFRGERARPFFDLLARVPDGAVRRVADLGCGTGDLARTLLERWPQATVWGVDHSEEMLARAAEGPAQPRMRFVRADLAHWEPEAPLDRIVLECGAAGLPEHGELLERLTLPRTEGVSRCRCVSQPRRGASGRSKIWARGRAERLRAPTPPLDRDAPFLRERLLRAGARVEPRHLSPPDGGPAEIVEWMKERRCAQRCSGRSRRAEGAPDALVARASRRSIRAARTAASSRSDGSSSSRANPELPVEIWIR